MDTKTHSAITTAKSANELKFHQEFVVHANALSGFAFRLTQNRAEADDLVQETYLRIWRFIDKYQEQTNARAWMFRICYHTFVNTYRKDKNSPIQGSLDVVEKRHESEKNISRSQIFEHNFENIGDEVKFALDALSDDFRDVILLDLEDFTYEEIAVQLDIKIGTVRSRLHRARKQLASNLGVYANNLGFNVKDAENQPAVDGENRRSRKKQ